MMDVDDLILITLSASEDGKIEGRTRLQKLAFFVSEIMGIDAGYEPHIYGPYSSALRNIVEAQVSRGIISEQRVPWSSSGFSGHDLDKVRYDYELKPQGKLALDERLQADPQGFARAQELVQKVNSTGADYRVLSWAAKLYWILAEERGRPVPLPRAQERAHELGWPISHQQAQQGIALLRELELVRVVSTPAQPGRS